MPNSIDRALKIALSAPFFFAQILVQQRHGGGFVLSHRDDGASDRLKILRNAEDAIEIAKYDDTGNYRPLKTAPNLCHGWRLELDTPEQLRHALDYFYPGRLAVFAAWQSASLRTTPLRETLARQSGMYRVAAKISEPQLNDLVANFCRSDGGCLRTILWKRDASGTVSSTKLPNEKFDPAVDQARLCSRRPAGDAPAPHPPSLSYGVASSEATTVPLLCQEPCNLLIAECRKVVKGESAATDV